MRHLLVLAVVLGVAGWAAAVGSAQASATCTNSGVTNVGPITMINGTASVTFTVPAACDSVQLSLVSYKATSLMDDEANWSQQTLYKSATQTFAPGTYTLSVEVPSCYFQVDFVYGTPIEHLGPAGSDNFYGQQGRYISGVIGGTTACESNNGGGNEQPAQVSLCHATGTPDNGNNGYVKIAVDVEGAYSGHLSQHDADIIPPFTRNGVTYSQHWDAAGQAVYNNGCVATQSSTNTGGNGDHPEQPVVPQVPPAPVPLPSITLTKLERVGATGSFTAGPLTAAVGDTVYYQLVVKNTGTTDVSVNIADGGCTGIAPAGPQALVTGASITYTCSHVITAADGASYTNVAVATANNAGPVQVSVQARVAANVGTIAPNTSTSTNTSGSGVLGTTKTVTKHKAVVKKHKVKKVVHKAKAAHAVRARAAVTG